MPQKLAHMTSLHFKYLPCHGSALLINSKALEAPSGNKTPQCRYKLNRWVEDLKALCNGHSSQYLIMFNSWLQSNSIPYHFSLPIHSLLWRQQWCSASWCTDECDECRLRHKLKLCMAFNASCRSIPEVQSDDRQCRWLVDGQEMNKLTCTQAMKMYGVQDLRCMSCAMRVKDCSWSLKFGLCILVFSSEYYCELVFL